MRSVKGSRGNQGGRSDVAVDSYASWQEQISADYFEDLRPWRAVPHVGGGFVALWEKHDFRKQGFRCKSFKGLVA